GSFGQTLSDSVRTAIKARTGVGMVGLVGVLLTGLGWIGNLRAAIDAVWGRRPAQRNFFLGKAMNLLVLAGLGLGIVISLGLTVVGTASTDQILRVLSLDHIAGIHYLAQVLGLAVAVVGDFLIFSWLLVRLPVADVPARVALKGAVFASIGFEVLKIVGTVTIAKSAGSHTAGPFASLLAVLIWIQLVARFMLFCAAWMAVLTDEQAVPAPVPVAAASSDEREPSEPMNSAALGVALVGAGALAGAAAAVWAVTSRRGRDSDD
ncbi:MAG: YhjD/YihY/BrkB family envelope integrity protein, partial [Jatrophihabitantaceae bacterium]